MTVYFPPVTGVAKSWSVGVRILLLDEGPLGIGEPGPLEAVSVGHVGRLDLRVSAEDHPVVLLGHRHLAVQGDPAEVLHQGRLDLVHHGLDGSQVGSFASHQAGRFESLLHPSFEPFEFVERGNPPSPPHPDPHDPPQGLGGFAGFELRAPEFDAGGRRLLDADIGVFPPAGFDRLFQALPHRNAPPPQAFPVALSGTRFIARPQSSTFDPIGQAIPKVGGAFRGCGACTAKTPRAPSPRRGFLPNRRRSPP
jgi:hypothetical protein